MVVYPIIVLMFLKANATEVNPGFATPPPMGISKQIVAEREYISFFVFHHQKVSHLSSKARDNSC